MLLSFTPEDLARLAGPIGVVAGLLGLLLNPAMRALLLKGQPPPKRSRYPVSPACPSCGAGGYKGIEPETPIAFMRDRVCKACGTRYTPPTPFWAGYLFILLGLFLLGLVLYSAVTNRMAVMAPGIAGHLFEAVIGLGAIPVMAFGLRALRENAAAKRESKRC
jgi:hypothetical protein